MQTLRTCALQGRVAPVYQGQEAGRQRAVHRTWLLTSLLHHIQARLHLVSTESLISNKHENLLEAQVSLFADEEVVTARKMASDDLTGSRFLELLFWDSVCKGHYAAIAEDSIGMPRLSYFWIRASVDRVLHGSVLSCRQHAQVTEDLVWNRDQFVISPNAVCERT